LKKYPLRIKHLSYDYNEQNKLDLDSLFLDKTIELSKNEWDHLKAKLNEAYFWRIHSTADYDDGADGSTWSIEGYKYFRGKKKFHVVEIWAPRKSSYLDACLYMMDLCHEDFSMYDAYVPHY
jgi:hypothetical protein